MQENQRKSSKNNYPSDQIINKLKGFLFLNISNTLCKTLVTIYECETYQTASEEKDSQI